MRTALVDDTPIIGSRLGFSVRSNIGQGIDFTNLNLNINLDMNLVLNLS